MKTSGIGIVIAMVGLTVITTSCGEYEQIERKKELIIQADSLFATKRDSLRKVYDNYCVLNHDSLYNESLDSIKAKQIGEIKDLIDN